MSSFRLRRVRWAARAGAPLVAFFVAFVPAASRASKPAVPDSLAEVKRLRAVLRPTDPALVGLAERVAARRAADGRARPSELAAALETLGELRLVRLENREADSLFQRALALRRSERRPDPRAVAKALGWTAETARTLKQLARAESLSNAALAEFERLESRDAAVESRTLSTLGNALAERGDGDRAVAALERAIECAEAVRPPDSTLLARTLGYLGRAESSRGNDARSLVAYDRAIEIQESALGPWSTDLAMTHYLATFSASALGDYVSQKRHALRALEIRERAFGPDHPLVGTTLAAVGGAIRNLGDREGAMPYYERAVRIHRAAGRNPADLAIALNNLGANRVMTGDGRGALEALNEARAIRERAFGPGRGTSTWSLTMTAAATLVAGDPRGADSLVRDVMGGARRLSDTEANETLVVLGAASVALGRPDTAYAAYSRSLGICERAYGQSSARTLESRLRRSITAAVTGRPDEAWTDARDVDAHGREVLRDAARALSEAEALSFERIRSLGRAQMLTLAAGAPMLPPARRVEAFDAVIRGRLLVLDELADRGRASRAWATPRSPPPRPSSTPRARRSRARSSRRSGSGARPIRR